MDGSRFTPSSPERLLANAKGDSLFVESDDDNNEGHISDGHAAQQESESSDVSRQDDGHPSVVKEEEAKSDTTSGNTPFWWTSARQIDRSASQNSATTWTSTTSDQISRSNGFHGNNTHINSNGKDDGRGDRRGHRHVPSEDLSRPARINLEDRSSSSHDVNAGCWARSVFIDAPVVIGDVKHVGAYVVWPCTVYTLTGGGDVHLRKRYSDFDRLRKNLVSAFPHAAQMIPALPRKSFVSRFRPWFLEQRRDGLSHFLNCILLNSEFAASPILKEFIFS